MKHPIATNETKMPAGTRFGGLPIARVPADYLLVLYDELGWEQTTGQDTAKGRIAAWIKRHKALLRDSGDATMRQIQRRLCEELEGDECACGRRKKARQTFCWECYRRLPRTLQTGLYSRIGDGYEAAYSQSIERLNR